MSEFVKREHFFEDTTAVESLRILADKTVPADSATKTAMKIADNRSGMKISIGRSRRFFHTLQILLQFEPRIIEMKGHRR